MMPPDLPESASWSEIRPWRRAAREELIQRRAALGVQVRRELGHRALEHLAQAVDIGAFAVLGFCWPIRGEIDPRPIVERHLERGGIAALPVVVEKAAPLEFWRWVPGMPMQTGIWNIPIPKTRELVAPDVLIAPLVGYDRSGYRLGYGGGYFDRTLGAARPRPFAIGLGYADAALASIHPQPHDIPMDLIATDREVIGPRPRAPAA